MSNLPSLFQENFPTLVALADEVGGKRNGYFKELIPKEIIKHLKDSENSRLADYLRINFLNETEISILAFLRNNIHIKKEANGQIVRVYTGTIQKYTQILCRFFNFTRFHVRGIQSYHLADFINKGLDSDLAVNTLNLQIRALRSYFRFLNENGFLPNNPAIGLKEIKGGKKYHSSHVLSLEEAKALMNYARENTSLRNYLILAVLRFGGLRREEVAGLKFTDLVQGAVSGGWMLEVTGKGNKERSVPIMNALAQEILKYRQDVFGVPREILSVPGLKNTFMFGKSQNPFKPLSTNYIYKLVQKLGLEALGKRITPHWLRHTYVTHLKIKKVDIKTISILVGHESLQTTLNYEQSFHLQQGNYGDILVDEY